MCNIKEKSIWCVGEAKNLEIQPASLSRKKKGKKPTTSKRPCHQTPPLFPIALLLLSLFIIPFPLSISLFLSFTRASTIVGSNSENSNCLLRSQCAFVSEIVRLQRFRNFYVKLPFFCVNVKKAGYLSEETTDFILSYPYLYVCKWRLSNPG